MLLLYMQEVTMSIKSPITLLVAMRDDGRRTLCVGGFHFPSRS
jgi:hypothetical protein